MRNSIRSDRGLTLVEILVALVLTALVGTILVRSFVTMSRFFTEVSQQSRQLGSATSVLNRCESLCFGLPSQAFSIETNSDESLLIVHPRDGLTASGRAVYSDRRIVIQSNEDGVFWWTVGGQDRQLGSLISSFPVIDGKPILQNKKLLDEGWELKAEFEDGRFPLQLTLTTPDNKTFHRTLAGHI